MSDDRLVEKARKKLYDFIINFDEENVIHKEELFRLKLKLFESVSVQNAERNQKAKIRRSNSPVEVFSHFYDITKPKKKTRSSKKSAK